MGLGQPEAHGRDARATAKILLRPICPGVIFHGQKINLEGGSFISAKIRSNPI
jgi:hypothetical protein